MPKMKKVLIILIVAFITFACNGQAKEAQRKEAVKKFKTQQHRFEIKGYKIYYRNLNNTK